MTHEVWKPVFGFESRYGVSSLGRIKALEREIYYVDGRKGRLSEKLLRGSRTKEGYLAVTFDSKTRRYIHQVVAQAFLDPAEYRQTINHKDGDKTNNRVENLEWATYKENNAHARKTNLNCQHGEDSNLHKYSDRFIQAIRNVHLAYSPTYEKLGKLFGITGAHARQIVLYETRAKRTVRTLVNKDMA